jgi:hypothetical protein
LFKRLPLSLFITKETGRKSRSTVFRFLEMGTKFVMRDRIPVYIKERKDKVREENI